MHALVIHAPLDLRIEDVPTPEPEANQLLVRVRAGGICGSDLHYFNHGGFGTIRIKEPMVLGHEVSGAVARPGTYEVSFGTTLRELLELAGGIEDLRTVLLGVGQLAIMKPEPDFIHEFVAHMEHRPPGLCAQRSCTPLPSRNDPSAWELNSGLQTRWPHRLQAYVPIVPQPQ